MYNRKRYCPTHTLLCLAIFYLCHCWMFLSDMSEHYRKNWLFSRCIIGQQDTVSWNYLSNADVVLSRVDSVDLELVATVSAMYFRLKELAPAERSSSTSQAMLIARVDITLKEEDSELHSS